MKLWFSSNPEDLAPSINWVELNGDMPVISMRDLTIQRRENDLVAASFGRGLFILDDYSPLRDVSPEILKQDHALFSLRKAWWYIEHIPMGFSEKASRGNAFFNAPNPPFGAVFTYYLKDEIKTLAATRKALEKPLIEKGKDTPFPGWDTVEMERRELAPSIILRIRDAEDGVHTSKTG